VKSVEVNKALLPQFLSRKPSAADTGKTTGARNGHQSRAVTVKPSYAICHMYYDHKLESTRLLFYSASQGDAY
jgi:hypothetical protein